MTGSRNAPDAGDSDWPEQLPAAFYTALDQMNAGAYFECHETLEHLWRLEKGRVREIYQGTLQIAVGCYHLTARANWVGAVNKLQAGTVRLRAIGLEEPAHAARYGVDWPALLRAADRLEAHLRALGREQTARFDRALLPRIACRRNIV